MPRKSLLTGLMRPKGIQFEHDEVEHSFGRFIAYPFERGYGVTVGNTLRRILLSSIPGYAVSAIHVTSYDAEGVPRVLSSEFDSIPHVVEDTPDVINALKQLRIALTDELDQKTILIEKKGPGELTGADLGEQIRILNPDLKLATLMEDANLALEIQIELGRGYVPAERHEQYIQVVGTVAVDAIFSPVLKAKYMVENTRVGHRTDYDKLILEITTDGTVSPEDALAEAAKIAKEQFTIFINFDEEEGREDDSYDAEDERARVLLHTPVKELELSVRSSNCLQKAQIYTIWDLVTKTEEEIKKTRNFGTKSLDEIKSRLAELNLRLGISDYDEFKTELRREDAEGAAGTDSQATEPEQMPAGEVGVSGAPAEAPVEGQQA